MPKDINDVIERLKKTGIAKEAEPYHKLGERLIEQQVGGRFTSI
jgi:hypothetical protein